MREEEKKKGGIKVHTNIHANEGVPSDIRFTSAATNDSFMLKPTNYSDGDIIAMDRAYIDYSKFEDLTNRGVVYVTKMKKNLVYEVLSDTMYMAPEGLMEHRVQIVEFRHALLPMPILIRKSQNSYHCLPMTWKWKWRILSPYTAKDGR